MRHKNDLPSAPDFTQACVVMFGVNITWILLTIWALWGLLVAAALAWGVNRLIDYIAARRG